MVRRGGDGIAGVPLPGRPTGPSPRSRGCSLPGARLREFQLEVAASLDQDCENVNFVHFMNRDGSVAESVGQWRRRQHLVLVATAPLPEHHRTGSGSSRVALCSHAIDERGCGPFYYHICSISPWLSHLGKSQKDSSFHAVGGIVTFHKITRRVLQSAISTVEAASEGGALTWMYPFGTTRLPPPTSLPALLPRMTCGSGRRGRRPRRVTTARASPGWAPTTRRRWRWRRRWRRN